MEWTLDSVRSRLVFALLVSGQEVAATLLQAGAAEVQGVLLAELDRACAVAEEALQTELCTLTRLYPSGGDTPEYHQLFERQTAANSALEVAQALRGAARRYFAAVAAASSAAPQELQASLEAIVQTLRSVPGAS